MTCLRSFSCVIFFYRKNEREKNTYLKGCTNHIVYNGSYISDAQVQQWVTVDDLARKWTLFKGLGVRFRNLFWS
jgi:hypothetical protein